jgi:lipopolysaccharide export system permease protein
MRAITRYILRQLLTVSLFITGALTLAVWLSQSLRFMDYIVNRGLPVSDFLLFILLLLPGFLGIVLPIAAFSAVLFVYNKLANESELVVLRSAGLSHMQLARPALLLAIVVTALVYLMSLYGLPASYRAFKDLQFKIRNDYSTVLLQEGAFNTLGEDMTVYVRERGPDGELRGILVHDASDAEKPVTMMASRGALVQSEEGPRVVLVDGNRQEVSPDTGRLSVLYFDRYTVDVGQLRESVHTRWRQPKERFLPGLLSPGASPNDQRYRAELIAEGHNRLVFPAYTIVFVAIGLVAMLGGEFSRRGQLRRLLVAVIAVAALEALQLTLKDLATRSESVWPAMYVLLGAAMIVPFVLLFRRPSHRGESPPLAATAEAT